jgi:hypothetical protein
MEIPEQDYELIERRIMAKIVERDLALVLKEHFRKYLIKVGVAIVALAGGGVLYLASNIAEDIAREVARETAAETSATETANILIDNPELRGRLGDSIFAEISKLNGAVLAFDGIKSCPDGWDSYEEGMGRVIVGIGATQDDREETRDFKLGDSKGNFSQELTKDQLPAHSHRISTHNKKASQHDGLGGSGNSHGIDKNFDDSPQKGSWGVMESVVEETGEGEAHNNMPPYIALKYCFKLGADSESRAGQ